ncbi:hypothetical protein WICPIJ_006116 [Wickerhamomyces pijperi]|uniref:Uncharacterized protein n=1 Tax=Wickerhamomyces pijperi TaxID=599730 RepID=A0A9P8Q2A4_WICPI|nr:hypothetical protein WICPIJ_006116 [Wickerhamomyces pijperi]
MSRDESEAGFQTAGKRKEEHDYARHKPRPKRTNMFRCDGCHYISTGKEVKDHLKKYFHSSISYEAEQGRWIKVKCSSCSKEPVRDLVVLKTNQTEINMLMCFRCTKRQRKRDPTSFIAEAPFNQSGFFIRLLEYFKLDYITPDKSKKRRIMRLVEGVRHKPSYPHVNDYYRELIKMNQAEQSFTPTALSLTKIISWAQSGELTISVARACKQLRGLGDSPFIRGGFMYIIKPTSSVVLPQIWVAKIVTRKFNEDGTWRNSREQDCFVVDLRIVKELYSKQPINDYDLKFMLCDVGVNRSITAMLSQKNLVFTELLSGHTPIHENEHIHTDKIRWFNHNLNDSQKAGIGHFLHPENMLTVLKGPPGTGKTSTIVESILQIQKTDFCKFGNVILVCASSNIAIDNITEKLVNKGVQGVLRVVSTMKEQEYGPGHALEEICLHNQILKIASPDYKYVARMLANGNRNLIKPKELSNYYEERSERSKLIVARGVKILLATTVGSGARVLFDGELSKISVVIMDEATQSNQMSSLIPLSHPHVQKAMLVGDEKQLSAVSEIQYNELSLFEKLLDFELVKHPLLLDVQYRMHPMISEFPIKHFYANKLANGVTAADRTMKTIGVPKPLTFYSTGHTCKESRIRQANLNTGQSTDTFVNKQEAKTVVMILKFLLLKNEHLTARQVPIITPYAAQRDLIARLIQKDKFLNPKGLQVQEIADGEAAPEENPGGDTEPSSAGAVMNQKNKKKNRNIDGGAEGLETGGHKPPTVKLINGTMIATIDAFQGREEDYILFSCVRSNKFGNVGFLQDKRRLNVALTRARFGLIMVGNKLCLQTKDALWGTFLHHFELTGSIITDISAYLGTDRKGKQISQRRINVGLQTEFQIVDVVDDGLGELEQDLDLLVVSDSDYDDDDEEEDEDDGAVERELAKMDY